MTVIFCKWTRCDHNHEGYCVKPFITLDAETLEYVDHGDAVSEEVLKCQEFERVKK